MLSVNVALGLTDTAGLGKLQHGVCVCGLWSVCGLCVSRSSQQRHSNAFELCMLEVTLDVVLFFFPLCLLYFKTLLLFMLHFSVLNI